MEQVTLPSVLTLEEVSEYLRLPIETLQRQARLGKLPGRKIENEWRFLKVVALPYFNKQVLLLMMLR
jgi:propanediol dehydratase small subunit